MTNIALTIVLIVALGVVQVSFLTTWPAPVNSLNIILSLVVFLAIIIDYKKSLWLAFGAGLFLELYSDYPFGLTLLALLLTTIAVHFLFTNFFTNRSLYSLIILGFIASIVYNFLVTGLLLGLTVSGYDSGTITFNFWSNYVWQPFFNLVVLAIIFLAYYFSTGRLKYIFLFPAN